jgi:hypothetical protein
MTFLPEQSQPMRATANGKLVLHRRHFKAGAGQGKRN